MGRRPHRVGSGKPSPPASAKEIQARSTQCSRAVDLARVLMRAATPLTSLRNHVCSSLNLQDLDAIGHREPGRKGVGSSNFLGLRQSVVEASSCEGVPYPIGMPDGAHNDGRD